MGKKERVRKGLARLALHYSRTLLPELLGSKDVAFRAAAYAAGDLNADQLRAGYERDGELVFTEAIRNLALWRRQATRQVLRDIAWGIVGNDTHSDLLAVNLFKSMEKDMRKHHPAWFFDDNESEAAGQHDVDEQAPATKADLSAIASRMGQQSQALEAISQALKPLINRVRWIWWFSLGALVASLRHI